MRVVLIQDRMEDKIGRHAKCARAAAKNRPVELLILFIRLWVTIFNCDEGAVTTDRRQAKALGTLSVSQANGGGGLKG